MPKLTLARFLTLTADTGEGFSLAQIEANPPAFFTDVHTADYLAGAIRGQLELTGTIY
jgi:hypothetical protein